jgi:hypothetical protein
VKILKTENNLSSVEPGMVRFQPALSLDQLEELSALNEVHHDV